MSDPVDASLEELHALVNLIKTSVDQIEKTYKSNKQPFPSLNGPFNPPSEGLRMSPEVQQAGDILVAAASQLIATVRPPFTTTIVYGLSFHIEASMRVAVENHVVEILREAGPQGLHVRDIAAHTKVNPEKLARILRLLATHHMFREVAPDVFANNAISMTLDTGKPVEAILADPEAKYDNTSGVAALVAHSGDEVLKATGYLQEVLADPSWTASGDPAKTSLQKAFNMNVPYWEWLEAPGNSSRRRRFAAGMTGLSNATYSSAILEGFEWKELPKDSVVVDVGGGVGSQSLLLAKAFDHLKLIVQDRPAVVTENAPGYWKENLPEALSSGQVVLQAHDFFAPQPVKAPAVFLLRCILHDWSDEYAIKILRQLRDAAGPKTQLLVIESLMSYACPTPENTKKIPGQVENTFPEPLLPNRGAASSMAALSDLLMLNLINATERTLEQYDQLFEQGGWKLTRVHLAGGPQGAKLVAVPA